MSEKLTKQKFITDVFDYEKFSEWKYTGDVPCIIDFYADWCQPCKMVSPILEDMAKKYEGKIKVYKINTDQESELASIFNIRSIPSILFIPMEGQPQMAIGSLPKVTIEKVIHEVLVVPAPVLKNS
ncbi:MAG: thioredoxin [Candidatus Marinimicrobia bacterium CG08_land_8_20_14_0_20_45_22]|nr:MAG: thioredoxin [Candidatus Marinimicrobia bacterium CG08_land_8_20_14_0_20_45_22]